MVWLVDSDARLRLEAHCFTTVNSGNHVQRRVAPSLQMEA